MLAHGGPYSQYEYGGNYPYAPGCGFGYHPETGQDGPLQPAVICGPTTAALGVDVDNAEAFAASETGKLLRRDQAWCTRGEGFHIVLDVRGLDVSQVKQGPTGWGDLKWKGFLPYPGSEHYSGEKYEPTGLGVLTGQPAVIAAVMADRAKHAAAKKAAAAAAKKAIANGAGPGAVAEVSAAAAAKVFGHAVAVGTHRELLLELLWDAGVAGYGTADGGEAAARLAWAQNSAPWDADRPWTTGDFENMWRGVPRKVAESRGVSAGAASNATVSDREAERPKVVVSREDGGAILAAIEDAWRRFVVWGSEHEAVAVTLWSMHTHAIDAADCTPYLDIGSAVFESGKTRVLEVAELIVRRSWRISEPTEATLFRKIEQDRPTLLVDEYDAIWGGKADGREGLRAVFDVGYRRGGSVPRCVGDGLSLTVADFPVFCPKALAGIAGTLPRAIATRSIPVRLRRRKKSEPVDRFRDREARALLYPLRDRAAAWAELVTEELRDAAPALPWALTDRQQDCWEPLLAIADLAGGDWPQRARAAALAIHVTSKDDPSTGELLLRHIADAFIAAQAARLPTVGLLQTLIARDDGPWADWWEKPMSQTPALIKGPSMRLAALLKPFGITPEPYAVGPHGQARGYRLESFSDAWDRYGISVTSEPPSPPAQDARTQGSRSAAQKDARTPVPSVQLKPSASRHPSVLATSPGGGGHADGNGAVAPVAAGTYGYDETAPNPYAPPPPGTAPSGLCRVCGEPVRGWGGNLCRRHRDADRDDMRQPLDLWCGTCKKRHLITDPSCPLLGGAS